MSGKGAAVADEILTPRFSKKALVRISPYNKQGKAKSELAKKALPYVAHVAEVVRVNAYEAGPKVVLMYTVKLEDGITLQLTEDCLMPVDGRF
jgi:hypothetical protein